MSRSLSVLPRKGCQGSSMPPAPPSCSPPPVGPQALAVPWDEGWVLTSMPGFPGGPSGPGAPGSPLAPWRRKRPRCELEKAPPGGKRQPGGLGGGDTGTHRRAGGSRRAFVTLGKRREVANGVCHPTELGPTVRGARDQLCASQTRRKAPGARMGMEVRKERALVWF